MDAREVAKKLLEMGNKAGCAQCALGLAKACGELWEDLVAASLNPSWAKEELLREVDKKQQAYPEGFSAWLGHVAERSGLWEIGQACALAQQELDKLSGLVRARVSSAFELGQADIEELKAALRARFKAKEVDLVAEVDKGLMAGMRVCVGDWVMENSAANDLRRLAAELAKP